MCAHLRRNLAFGRLQIEIDECNASIHIWNFMSGYHVAFVLDIKQFGRFQDYGVTLEHVFFFFSANEKCRIVGFNSSNNVGSRSACFR